MKLITAMIQPHKLPDVKKALFDADVHKMTVSTAGMTIMTMSVNVTDRKVEGKEKITTTAGSFNCTKIAQTVNMQAIINVTARSTEWYAKDVGMIKSESYDSDGILTSTTELVSIE